jgi:AcrR family transcriptional regulator
VTDHVRHDETVEQLWRACSEWAELANHLQSIADAGYIDGSRLAEDNAAVTFGDASIAVTRYVQERTWNAARMLRFLHRFVFHTHPGRFNMDATVMYPVMRAALEDAATVVWLQSPDEQSERLVRAFRVFFTESEYFTTNHSMLAGAVTGDEVGEYGARLSEHMAEEREAVREHFRSLTTAAGIDPALALMKVATSAPIQVVYGAESVEFVTWKFLSDLSHFSFMMLRHLATTPVPNSDARLEHVTVLQFSRTVNRVCRDAVRLLELVAVISD